jgi:hypothetical protein
MSFEVLAVFVANVFWEGKVVSPFDGFIDTVRQASIIEGFLD